jgi:topoisomerase IA-like protein
MDSQFISLAQSDGTIDPVQAQVELIAMAHDYYRHQEGHDYIMVFNSNNGEYVMIKDGNDVRSLMKSGDLKSTAAFDLFDDRSKGSPQLLTK